MSSETHTVWEDINGLGRWRIRKWSPPTTHEPPADLLHPLATIQWETCWELEEEIYHAYIYYAIHCVDNDRLYLRTTDMVLEFSADLAAWKVLPLPPVSDFGLDTYHSQLVLVGGWLNRTTSNKLWVYDNDAWHCSLPPMPTGRQYPVVVNTGTPEYLVVAGGWQYSIARNIEVVEVLVEGQWVSCAPLYSNPRDGCIHNGNLYFLINNILISNCQKSSMVYCQLESLVKACVQPDGVSDTGKLWNCLPDPDAYIYYIEVAAYGKFLICLTSSGDLHALSPETESWVHVGTGRWQDRLITLCTGELAAVTREYKLLNVKLLSVKGTDCIGRIWTCIAASYVITPCAHAQQGVM